MRKITTRKWRPSCTHALTNPKVCAEHLLGRITSISHPRSLGIGEIGLDYHYDNSPREIQQRVLRRQLEVYRDHCLDPSNVGKRRKTLVIHTREAEEDTERTLKDVLGSENGEERAKWKVLFLLPRTI
jgi:Tat protein secretion system quality control protein TatD with DNase activity